MYRLKGVCIRTIVLVLLFVLPIFGDVTIAIDKNSKIDKMSANLICLFYATQKDGNDKVCHVLESEDPLKLLKTKIANFAIASGDRLNAYKKSDELNSIASLYKNILFFIVPKNGGIDSFESTINKKIKIGILKKDQDLIHMIEDKFHIKKSQFLTIKKRSIASLINSKKIGAALIQEPMVSDLVKRVLKKENLTLRQLSNKKFSQMIRSNNFILKSMIHKEEYPILDHDIATIGSKTVLITRKNSPSHEIYNLTNAIFSNIHRLKRLHPIYKEISKKALLEEMVLPQHEEAIRAMNGLDLNSSI